MIPFPCSHVIIPFHSLLFRSSTLCMTHALTVHTGQLVCKYKYIWSFKDVISIYYIIYIGCNSSIYTGGFGLDNHQVCWIAPLSGSSFSLELFSISLWLYVYYETEKTLISSYAFVIVFKAGGKKIKLVSFILLIHGVHALKRSFCWKHSSTATNCWLRQISCGRQPYYFTPNTVRHKYQIFTWFMSCMDVWFGVALAAIICYKCFP